MKTTAPASRRFSRVVIWMKRHGPHLFFGLSLVSLTLLLTWWALFINRAVQQEYEFHRSSLEFRGKAFAFMLGHESQEAPPTGTYAPDDRFEVVPFTGELPPYAYRLLPYWGGYVIQPRPAYMAAIQKKFRSRSVMVIGEGGLLLLLILVSSFMLYRIIWLERRSAEELHEFWRRITHEIKTPITGLKAFLQTLKTQDLSREELQPLVDLALQEVERQQQLAQNILIGQRLDRDAMGLSLVDVRLAVFVRKYVRSHGLQLSEGDAQLTVQCADEVTVRADLDAVHVILDNLTDNALKYAGPDGRLQIEVHAGEVEAEITIADNGAGFDPGMAENIFEAYRRLTKELPAGKHGTGMGLYISRELARKMGGDLVAASDGPGRGARFTLVLPRVDTGAEDV